MARALKIFAVLLVVLGLLGAGAYVALLRYASPVLSIATQEGDQRGLLAAAITRFLSTPNMQISIGAIDGALSSDATIRDLVISDAGGPWLRLDRARLVWTRAALLFGRLDVQSFDVGRLDILRRPLPGPADQPTESPSGPLIQIPQLPLRIVVGAFALQNLDLGGDVLGVPAQLTAKGSASLGRPQDGFDLVFALKRLDAPGAIDIDAHYNRDSGAIKLAVAAHEPAAGLVAHAARLPGLPPLDLDLNGDGAVQNFSAKIAFSAGTAAGVAGDGAFRRVDAGHQLTLDLAGTVEHLLPATIAPIFSGQTTVTARADFGDDGVSKLDQFAILAKKARLDAVGTLSAANEVDGHVTVAALPDDSGVFRSGEATIKKFDLRLDAKGFWLSPAVDLSLHVADAALPLGAIGRFDAQFSARPDGLATDSATKIGVKFSGAGEKLALTDRGLAGAIGESVRFDLDGVATPGGETHIEHGKISTVGAEISAQGDFGRNRLDGALAISAPDLARYAALAGLKLSGALVGDLKLTGAPATRKIDAALSLKGQKLATGLPVVDGLIGGSSAISGGLALDGEILRFDRLALDAANASVLVNGAVGGADQGKIEFSALAADLSKLGVDVAGRFEAKGAVTGTLARPDAQLTVTLSDLRSMGRDAPRFVLDAKAENLVEAPKGALSVNGVISGKPAEGGLSFARDAAGVWTMSSDGLRLGSVALSGAGAVTPELFADGRLDLKAEDLNDLSPLLLQKISGALQAGLKFSHDAGRQSFAAAVKGERLGARFGAQNFGLDKLDVDLRGADLFGTPKIDGFAALDRVAFGGELVPKLRLTAQSAPAGTNFALSSEARGVALDARGLLRGLRPAALDLTALQARGAGQTLGLSGTARIAQTDKGVDIRNLALASGGGRIALDGTIGGALDLSLVAQKLPLALVRLVAPNVALEGGLDANARVAGAPGALSGDWRVAIPRLSGPQIRAAGLDPVAISASGRLQGDRTTLAATMTLPRNGRVDVNGTAPLSATGPLDVSARGALDAGLANALLADGGQTLSGRIALDARAQGAVSDPKISGSVTLANGAFEDPLNGLSFKNISARLRGDGDRVAIDSFSAAARNGGAISASGSVQVAPDAGFPANFRITGRNAQLVSNESLTAVGSLALEISGPLARRPKISGRIAFDRIDVSVADRIPQAAQPLTNLRFIDPSRAAQLRLALIKQAEARRSRAAARGPAFSADLNLTISAPSRIFVRGHGMDAELGGELTVVGDLNAPSVHGGFQLRRGTFSMAGKRFDFTRGNINFLGSTVPQLDFATETTAGDVTARIAISGPADAPQFAFSSSPELPQDEVISRLLFASASGSLTPIQGLQLAQTMAEFSGIGGGGGVLERMRRSLGLDSLNMRLGSDGNPSVGANRYISNNVNVGVTTGAKPGDNAVTIGVDITKRIRVQGQAAADGSASAGISTQWEYGPP